MKSSLVQRSRSFLLALFVVSSCFTVPGVASETNKSERASTSVSSKPNILFIAIDDQNDWIGCLKGHPMAKTPHMDRLAKRGTLFSNAHCQSPLCNPSRTSLMFSIRPSTSGIYGLAPWIRNVPALKDRVSLAQHLAANGYRTYSTGKIFHGRYARQKGSKEFDVMGPRAGVGKRPNKPLVRTPGGHPLVDWGCFPHEDEEKGDFKVAQWAVDQLSTDLKGAQKEPFFLSVGFFLPHVPCYATQKWFDLYPNDRSVLPPMKDDDRADTPRFSWYIHWKLPEPRRKFLIENNEEVNLVRSYLACTSFIDAQIGRLLDALQASGHAEDTIVVLWSDHGYHLGEKEITGKNTLWEESTRVPLLFAGPGVPAGQNCVQPAELLDIYPTLIDLCGLPERDELEGHSLLAQIKDPETKREFPAITTHNHDNHSVRSERYRYITYADGSEEFYDLESDPQEWNNLATSQSHRALMDQHKKYVPRTSAMPVENSKHRILTFQNGVITWEGKTVEAGAAIPEMLP